MAATSAAWPHIPDMVRIAISQAAFDAIAGTMALGSVGFENAPAPKNEVYVWLRPYVGFAVRRKAFSPGAIKRPRRGRRCRGGAFTDPAL
jgi:hypothetical protein